MATQPLLRAPQRAWALDAIIRAGAEHRQMAHANLDTNDRVRPPPRPCARPARVNEHYHRPAWQETVADSTRALCVPQPGEQLHGRLVRADLPDPGKPDTRTARPAQRAGHKPGPGERLDLDVGELLAIASFADPLTLLQPVLDQPQTPVIGKPRRAAIRPQRPLLRRREIQRKPARLRDEHRLDALHPEPR